MPPPFRVLLTQRPLAQLEDGADRPAGLVTRLGRWLRNRHGPSEAAPGDGVDAVVDSSEPRPAAEQDQVPTRIPVPETLGGGELLVHRPRAWGGPDTPPPTVAVDPEAWNIVLAEPEGRRPHTPGRFHQIQHLLDQQADLVLGPGTGLQALRSRRRWALTPGDTRHVRTVLEVAGTPDRRSMTLALYPLAEDGTGTDGTDLECLLDRLRRASPNGWSFADPQIRTAEDELGAHLRLPLGTWEPGFRPVPPTGLLDGRDPDETEPFRAHGAIRRGLERFSPSRHLGASLNAEAAARAGAQISWVSARAAVATTSAGRFLIDGYLAHSSQLGASISTDKFQTNRHLRRAGVPVTDAALVRSPAQAWEKARRIGLPVTLKPADREKGLGVSTDLRDEDSVVEAYRRARRHSRRIMIEQHVDIETELRVMASSQHCISITARTLPQVWGDGISTVEELVTERNAYRSTIFSLAGMDVVLDRTAESVLEAQGWRADDVPPVGALVTVGSVGGQSSGGDIAEVSHLSDGRIRDAAVAAVAAVPELRWGGVDLMVERGTGDVYVLEVNSRAGYGSATFPSSGASQDVAGHAWMLREEHAAGALEPWTSDLAPPTGDPEAGRLQDLPFVDGEVTSPARLLFAYAEHRGLTVSRRGPRLRSLSAPDGGTAPISARGLGGRDLAISCRTADRLGPLRRLLLHEGVPLVPAAVVADAQDLQTAELRGPLLATPYSSPWAGRGTRPVGAGIDDRRGEGADDETDGESDGEADGEADDADDVDWDRQERWIVQEAPAGARLRLFVHTGAVLTVLSAQDADVDHSDLRRAAELADAAVQAVPQLRWAVVDVVITRSADGDEPQVLVEGMSLSPRIRAEERMLAGRIEEFLDRLLPEEVSGAGLGR
ncbi:ATP-binding protein [Nesterenkonia marinintestina]|uniref:ATP-binding protein n=1 Tax=Nesterenkonia marinintestina TaxID=2979865 RepID=UPI0021C1E7F1|nr:hypothetical protein [Nesterenkonia sp. GX14115]